MTAALSFCRHLGGRRRAPADRCRPIASSGVLESSPVGGVRQGDLLNAVGVRACNAAEAWCRAAGRERTVRWGPRTLDVDVVTRRRADPAFILPPPRAHERAFVLAAWTTIDQGAHVPGYGRIAVLLDRLDASSVRRRDDLRLDLWPPPHRRAEDLKF